MPDNSTSAVLDKELSEDLFTTAVTGIVLGHAVIMIVEEMKKVIGDDDPSYKAMMAMAIAILQTIANYANIRAHEDPDYARAMADLIRVENLWESKQQKMA